MVEILQQNCNIIQFRTKKVDNDGWEEGEFKRGILARIRNTQQIITEKQGRKSGKGDKSEAGMITVQGMNPKNKKKKGRDFGLKAIQLVRKVGVILKKM